MSVKIRIYEGVGVSGHTELELIETRTVKMPSGGYVLTGRTVALLLEKEFPEFRSSSGISINKTPDGWSSTRCLRRVEGGSVHYFWQDAVVSMN